MNSTRPKIIDFNDTLNLENYHIVDVRTATDFFHGHIKGAKNIPFEKIDDWLSLLKDWGRPIIVCADWDCVSRRACEKLISKGVEAVDGGNWLNLEKFLLKNSLI